MLSLNCVNSSLLKSIVLLVCVVFIFVGVFKLSQPRDGPVLQFMYSQDRQTNLNVSNLLRQRNELSNLLNEIKQLYGQQSCEMRSLKKVDNGVSENGGWCKVNSGPKSPVHVTDRKFSQALSKFLKGKTVASFGDGPGEYKRLLDSYGEVVNYTAYDGAPYCEEVTEGRVKFLDLTAPQYRLPIFDWGISIEVAEHIPAKYENIFLDNLVRHVREGLILSWAVPGQGGLSHVNNKALNDVVDMMSKRGFSINITAGEPLRQSAIHGWLRNNVHVYYRISMDTLVESDA